MESEIWICIDAVLNMNYLIVFMPEESKTYEFYIELFISKIDEKMFL